MLPHLDDTIAAVASAPGAGVRGIVRISGRDLLHLLHRLVADLEVPASPSSIRCVIDLKSGSAESVGLDCDLYVWPTRRSYTGEPLAELHTVGSPPLLDMLLRTVLQAGAELPADTDCPGQKVRLAQPGEFTLRAFLAGRLDLTQAEAVLGVIDAQDLRHLQVALDQLAGGLSSRIIPLRAELLNLLADLEAGLDFADEALEFVSHAQLVSRLRQARDVVHDLQQHAGDRSVPNRLPRVVLVGPPNAGKSTLFNALAARDLALVSPERGTTRDYLAAELTWDGCAFMLVDTAGADDSTNSIDAQAQNQRQAQLTAADLIIACSPPKFAAVDEPANADHLSVRTMADLDLDAAARVSDRHGLTVSALTGEGLDELRQSIVQRLSRTSNGQGDWVASTAIRGRDALTQSAAALDRALEIAAAETDQAVLAIEIRDALDELGSIVGAVYTDDILDRIFSRFCIGK